MIERHFINERFEHGQRAKYRASSFEMGSGRNLNGEPTCILKLAAELGEGPIWSMAEECVWFVDIERRHIHRYQPRRRQLHTWPAPAAPGFVVPLAEGGLIAGLKTGLHRFDPHSGRFHLLCTVEPPELDNRLNDAHVDAQGRLWFGSMHDPELLASGALYRLDPHGQPLRMDDGYCVTNGPCTSPDGGTLYHADTLSRVIYAFDLNPLGQLANKRVFAGITRPGAFPDGLTVDAAGYVWVGLFGGWGAERYAPDGRLAEFLEMPCANITKVAFGDDDLRTLYVTTARKGLDAAQRAMQTLAGGLFAVRVATPGLPQHDVRLTGQTTAIAQAAFGGR